MCLRKYSNKNKSQTDTEMSQVQSVLTMLVLCALIEDA